MGAGPALLETRFKMAVDPQEALKNLQNQMTSSNKKAPGDRGYINAYGQEEAGASRWEQKKEAKRQMYEQARSVGDSLREDRVQALLDSRKAARMGGQPSANALQRQQAEERQAFEDM